MRDAAVTPIGPRSLLLVDSRKLLFSFSSFLAASITLIVAFTASFPRPWWAMLTVYVTAQPMSGAFRPKVLFRLGGILTGAVVGILLVPNLQNSPVLLVFCLAVWTGLCIYLAVLDRTPRAFLFQMAAFSSAVIGFPYIDDPGHIFIITVERVEEMVVAILSVTLVHALLQPWTVRPVIRERAHTFLNDASEWAAEALDTHETALEYGHRRRLAADVVELGMIAVNLPFDQRYALATRDTVIALQRRLATVLPLASAAANRLDQLRSMGAVDPEITAVVDALIAWLQGPIDTSDALDAALVERCRTLAAVRARAGDWASLLAASLCDRMAEFMEALHASRVLVRQFDETDTSTAAREEICATQHFPLARDHGLAMMAGAATFVAVVLYCTAWILLAWPTGSSTAAFAAIITCSFAAQDDPAPVIGRYLTATLMIYPLVMLYNLVILPRVDGLAMLILVLAPVLIWMGYVQASPAKSARALPMFSSFIVGIFLVDRFQDNFAGFANTCMAQIAGIVVTLAVTRLFRSANVRWTARRIIRANWLDLERLADPRTPLAADVWTAQATDRLGQIAARMAEAEPGDTLHAADGLGDLRIGRNIIQIRRGVEQAEAGAHALVDTVLERLVDLFRARRREGEPVPAQAGLLDAIDGAIQAAAHRQSGVTPSALLALVGMRCNLFPKASPYGPAAA